jgi:hypothetical protein
MTTSPWFDTNEYHVIGSHIVSGYHQETKKTLERAVREILSKWMVQGELVKMPHGAELEPGWDVATLQKLVCTDETVETAHRVFCSSGGSNETLSHLVRVSVNRVLGVDQIEAYTYETVKGGLFDRFAHETSTGVRVWTNVQVRFSHPFASTRNHRFLTSYSTFPIHRYRIGCWQDWSPTRWNVQSNDPRR